MGFHSDFSTFDTRSTALVEARRMMWLWAEPVIVDRVVEIYSRLLDDAGTFAMARRHCRLWRNILSEQNGSVSPIMVELGRSAAGLGLPPSVVEDTDDAILDELVDVVMCRYRSSRNDMKIFSLVLMSATSCLGVARVAA